MMPRQVGTTCAVNVTLNLLAGEQPQLPLHLHHVLMPGQLVRRSSGRTAPDNGTSGLGFLPAPETPVLQSQMMLARSTSLCFTAGASPSRQLTAKQPGLPTSRVFFVHILPMQFGHAVDRFLQQVGRLVLRVAADPPRILRVIVRRR